MEASSETQSRALHRPIPSGALREVQRRAAPGGGEARVELRVVGRPEPPASVVLPPASGAPQLFARIVGPGRLERGYRTRIAHLEGRLELAELVERGADRHLARIEERLAEQERDRRRLLAEAAERIQAERRLLLLMGAVQRENAALRARLAALEAAPPPAPPPLDFQRPPVDPAPSFIGRLLGRWV